MVKEFFNTLKFILLALLIPGIGNYGRLAASDPLPKQTFIINTCITDPVEFRELVKATNRLKKFGTVRINVSTLADKSFHEIPAGGNPWNEYASNMAALYKFFPDPKIAPFIPADFVIKNRKLLLEKVKILRDNGMEAAFFANEPAFLPAAFFEAYPLLRGPRVDHPRRSNHPCFSPCLSEKEMQQMYSGMMSELLKNAPEIRTVYFKTNDAGSGNCWSDWLYSGPNGPAACKGETTGERISKLMAAMQAGADADGTKLDVYLSHSQGSSNFSDAERTDIQNRLPSHCHFKSLPDDKFVSIGSDIAFLYPVKGVLNVFSVLGDLQKIDTKSSQTIFIGFGSFYDRGYESIKVENLILQMLEDYLLDSSSSMGTVAEKVNSYCRNWVGEKDAESLFTAFQDLEEAVGFRSRNIKNLYGIYWDVSSRMVNRPLVAAPQRLSEQEESYFLPYVFNVSKEEARMDYLDIHGGRWTTLPDSVRIYADKLKKVSLKLEAIRTTKPENNFISDMALALRVHASLMESCANFTEFQQLRDRNMTKLNGPIHRPSKESTWTGDPDLQIFNAIMRQELDNTAELENILKHGGLQVLCLAKDAAHEDCFLLNPDIIGQLKKKQKIMIDHWRDIEDYLTTPFK